MCGVDSMEKSMFLRKHPPLWKIVTETLRKDNMNKSGSVVKYYEGQTFRFFLFFCCCSIFSETNFDP